MDDGRRLGNDGLAALREDVEGLLRRRHDHVHGAHDHVARQERDVVMGAMDVVMPAAQKALDVLAEGGQAVVAKATALIH